MPESVTGCLPDEIEQGVYRIAQESLENVVRHAGATALLVELSENPDRVRLSVQDDGQGMEAEPTARAGDAGLGIRGMQERAALIGGELEIISEAGSGTRIVLTVPVERNSDDPCPDL
jgi:signal transduction histidine kinase